MSAEKTIKARLLDDELDAILRARGWWSRREHGRQNGYRAAFDAWGWGGAFPGGIDIRCVGEERYEVTWKTASTGEPMMETHSTRDAIVARAISLESLMDFMPN